MIDGNLQYISDTLFIEEILKKDASINGLVKNANILDGVAPAVKSFVDANIDKSSRESLIKSVLKLLEAGAFFKVHPLLWMINQGAQALGYSVTDILFSIAKPVKQKLESGDLPSADDVNQAGLALTDTSAVVAADLFAGLRKFAQRPEQGGSWFGGKGPWLYRAFGFLGARGSKNLIIGFIVWFMKTILLSAGLLAGSAAIKNMVMPDKKEEKSQQDTANYENPTAERASYTKVSPSPAQTVPLKSSGRGQEFYANDERNSWYISLINGNPAKTLLAWTIEIYPELSGYEGIILNSPDFRKTVENVSKDMERGKDYLLMPIGFNRRIDVVNQFIGDVYREFEKVNNEDATIVNI